MNKLSISVLFVIIISINLLSASDRTDANDLLAKCETESKQLEIPVRNFGDDKDIKDFESGITVIELGKIKLAQSKFLDAKAKFDEYLAVQYSIYKSLAEKYIKKTGIMIDEISVELVKSINDASLKNYDQASQYLEKAKGFYTTKHYMEAFFACRTAKKFLLDNYKLAGKAIPDNYKKDEVDINNKILGK